MGVSFGGCVAGALRLSTLWETGRWSTQQKLIFSTQVCALSLGNAVPLTILNFPGNIQDSGKVPDSKYFLLVLTKFRIG